MISNEHKLYLRKIKREKVLVHIVQILILIIVVFIWEYLSINNVTKTQNLS